MTIRGALGGAAGDLVSILRTRLEIFSLELAEEKSRIVCLAGMALAAARDAIYVLRRMGRR